MTRIKSILAATDLSAPARHAVDRGFQLAASTGAAYSVVHAFELDAMDALREWVGEDTAALKQQLESGAAEALARQLADPARNHGIAAAGRIALGPPLATILAQAATLDADLLVLGARGTNFLRRILLGTTASRLLRKSTRYPILVVKQPPHEPYRRILIPVDFSAAAVVAVRLARSLAPDAELILLHAYEAPFEGKLNYAGVDEEVVRRYRNAAREAAVARMHQLADAAGLSPGDYRSLIVHGDASQQTIVQEQEQDCDLIVIGKHGRDATEELLLGSVTKHVLNEAQSDVLVVVAEPAAAA